MIPMKNPASMGSTIHPPMMVKRASHMNGQKICLIWIGKQHKFYGWFGLRNASAVIIQKYIGQIPQLGMAHTIGLT